MPYNNNNLVVKLALLGFTKSLPVLAEDATVKNWGTFSDVDQAFEGGLTEDGYKCAVASGGYGYIGSDKATPIIRKFDLSTMSGIGAAPNTDYKYYKLAAVDETGKKGVFSTLDPGKTKKSAVVVIELEDMRTKAVIEHSDTDGFTSAVTAQNHVLYGTAGSPAKVYSFDMEDQTFESEEFTGDSGEDDFKVSITDGTHAYFVPDGTRKIVKIKVSDLSREGAVEVSGSSGEEIVSGVRQKTGNFGYFGTSTGRVVKVDLSALTVAETVDATSGDGTFGSTAVIYDDSVYFTTATRIVQYDVTGQTPSRVRHIANPGTNVEAVMLQVEDDQTVSPYAYYVGNTEPGSVHRVSLSTAAAAPTTPTATPTTGTTPTTDGSSGSRGVSGSNTRGVLDKEICYVGKLRCWLFGVILAGLILFCCALFLCLVCCRKCCWGRERETHTSQQEHNPLEANKVLVTEAREEHVVDETSPNRKKKIRTSEMNEGTTQRGLTDEEVQQQQREVVTSETRGRVKIMTEEMQDRYDMQTAFQKDVVEMKGRSAMAEEKAVKEVVVEEVKAAPAPVVKEEPVKYSQVDIWVRGGQGLKAVDTMGKSDPYVNVFVPKEKAGEADEKVLGTTVVDGSLNPKWNEADGQKRDVMVPNHGDVTFEVMDKDTFGSEPLGIVKIDGEAIRRRDPNVMGRHVYQIQPKKGTLDEKLGELEIEIEDSDDAALRRLGEEEERCRNGIEVEELECRSALMHEAEGERQSLVDTEAAEERRRRAEAEAEAEELRRRQAEEEERHRREIEAEEEECRRGLAEEEERCRREIEAEEERRRKEAEAEEEERRRREAEAEEEERRRREAEEEDRRRREAEEEAERLRQEEEARKPKKKRKAKTLRGKKRDDDDAED